ncbi:oligosaccharide flippase family protein [Sphingobacterium spiritivorum]|uniref:oligosaccharide flippase family protein n=1 Tax=Sphingobacterium spiritivorum TaxID=258 RepID=UPI003DA5C245
MQLTLKFFGDKKVKQSLMLLATSVVIMPLTLGINYFLTRLLGKEGFGDYSLVTNVFVFLQVVFNFGFFYSAGRLLAVSKDERQQREYYGVGILVVFVLFLIQSIIMYIFINTFNVFSDNNVQSIILFCIPFSCIFLFVNFNEQLLQGGNRIGLLSLSRLLPKTLFFFFLIFTFILFSKEMNVKSVLKLFLILSFLSYAVIVLLVKPVFNNFKIRLAEIRKATADYGFNIYIGSLIAVGASTLSGILISFFGVSNTEVGYYSIALQFSAPLSLVPNVLATVAFKQFANSDFLDKKLVIAMYSISIFSLLAIFVIAKPMILLIYGTEYVKASQLIFILSIGSILYGISDFYNRFLLSKGEGKLLRDISFFVGGTLLISNIILIKNYGAIGATFSTVISGLMYLILIIFNFRKLNIKIC